MSAPRHVMHLVESLEMGGMENGVVNVANRIDKGRFRLSVCCLSHSGALAERIADPRIAIHELGWRGGFRPRFILKLAALLRRERVAVLHTHGWLTLVYGFAAQLLAPGTRIVNGEHGTFHLDRPRRLALYRLIARFVPRYVAVSYSLERELVRILGEGCPVVTIPNGVDLARFAPADPEEKRRVRRALSIPDAGVVVGSVGRLEPVKNFALLVEAFARICADRDAYCVLIGDGSQRESLEALGRTLGVGERIRFTGRVDRPHEILPVLDLFVCSSLSEGMSNTIIEAMAAALPVVATEVGDNARLVAEGENGYLVPSGDLAALEGRLRLCLDPALRFRLGARSRALALERFDIGTMIANYEKLYDSVAEAGSP